MDNTRTLKDGEVPHRAIESVELMTSEMVDGIVDDFLEQLNRKGNTIDAKGIHMLKGVVKNRAKITLKIALKVDMDLVNDLMIPVRDMKQTTFDVAIKDSELLPTTVFVDAEKLGQILRDEEAHAARLAAAESAGTVSK